MSSAAMQLAVRECNRIWLQSLSARNFRNLERIELELAPEGAALVGDNGQGKTNILEAIYYLQLFRSFRGARDAELVRFGESAFHISARVEGGTAATISVGVELSGASGGERGARASRKRVKLDGVECPAIAEAIGILPSVLFAPRDAVLVYGGPAERRRYLDVMLSLVSPKYLRALQKYRAALARRNSALRECAKGSRRATEDDGIAAWEPALASSGAEIWAARVEWARQMAPEFESFCAAIGEDEYMTLSYSSRSNFPDDPEGALREMLERHRQLHVARGTTLDGPHRDDLTLRLRGRDLRSYGSAGQQRTAAIALRLIEAATLRRAHDREPLVLLDDPFAELDVRRATRILDLLTQEARGSAQTLLAVPRDGDVPARLTTLERYSVRDGRVQRS